MGNPIITALLGAHGGHDTLVALREHVLRCPQCLPVDAALPRSQHVTRWKKCPVGGDLVLAWISDRSLEGTRSW